MKRKLPGPVFWGSLIMVFCQAFTFFLLPKGRAFADANQITSPNLSLELPLIYFFGAVGLITVVLFLLPLSKLKIVIRALFVSLFSWGIFIVLGLTMPFPAALVISVTGGLFWLFKPKVWLHDLVLVFALVSMGSVFGFLLPPGTAIAFMLVVSVYDLLAVRFGYMLWMAKRLSESQAVPAFIIPRRAADLNLNLKEGGFSKVWQGEPAERDFSILGGGDIGFPLLLAVSVYFAYGFTGALIVAIFSLLGLISAYWIQGRFLKGKPMPALPPIAFLSLIGFLIVLSIS